VYNLNKFWKKFSPNEDGNVSVMFVAGGFTIATLVGFALEVSSLQSQQSKLQDNLDAATLALVTSGITEPQEQITFVKQYVKDSDFHTPLTNVQINTLPDFELQVSADATPDTNFSSLLGTVSNVSATSSAIGGATEAGTPASAENVDMVLVLDTTHSMEGAKLDTLKTAANNLISSLPNGEEVQVGIVPFSSYVNVGLDNRNAFWMDVEDDSQQIQTINVRENFSEALCLNGNQGSPTTFEGQTVYRTGDRVDVRDGQAILENGQLCENYQEEINIVVGTRERIREFTWKGCANSRWRTSRGHLEDSGYSDRIEGNLKADCAEPLLPMTSDKSAMTAKINSFVADHDTYMPGGIMWGRRVLSPQEPFTGGRSKDEARKIMVLMTDGLNSLHRRRFGDHGSIIHEADQEATLDRVNGVTKELCNLAKAEGTEIFSIAFEVEDQETRSLLEGCASQKDMFFNATNSSKLIEAFEDIAGEIDVVERTVDGVRLTR